MTFLVFLNLKKTGVLIMIQIFVLEKKIFTQTALKFEAWNNLTVNELLRHSVDVLIELSVVSILEIQ